MDCSHYPWHTFENSHCLHLSIHSLPHWRAELKRGSRGRGGTAWLCKLHSHCSLLQQYSLWVVMKEVDWNRGVCIPYLFWYSLICMAGGTVNRVDTSDLLVIDWPLPWTITHDGYILTYNGGSQMKREVYSTWNVFIERRRRRKIMSKFQKVLRAHVYLSIPQCQIDLLLSVCLSVCGLILNLVRWPKVGEHLKRLADNKHQSALVTIGKALLCLAATIIGPLV